MLMGGFPIIDQIIDQKETECCKLFLGNKYGKPEMDKNAIREINYNYTWFYGNQL